MLKLQLKLAHSVSICKVLQSFWVNSFYLSDPNEWVLTVISLRTMAGPASETQRLLLIAVFLQETMRKVHKTNNSTCGTQSIECYKCPRRNASQYAIEQLSFYLLKENC
jgi:hypothetical protein